MKLLIKNLLLLNFLFAGVYANAQEPIWLSNTPPESMEEVIRTSGMHRYSALDTRKTKKQARPVKKDSTAKKQNNRRSGGRSYMTATKYVHWMRKGSSVKDAKYICLEEETDYELHLFSPTGEKKEIDYVKGSPCYLKFEMNEEGYYNAYLNIRSTKGDTLFVKIAKAELLSHSCRNGHHKKLEARPVNTYPKVSEFEMYRKRHPYEDFHYFTFSGGDETFKTIYLGKPVSGAKVRINTEKGWSKTMLSNEDGEVNTEFIQDYFSEWKELEHRKIFYYMIEAEYIIKNSVNYKGKDYSYIHYTLTMSDGYRPSKTMYSSMVWGLIVFVITLVVSIGGIFIYKERRKKPYKEITFKES